MRKLKSPIKVTDSDLNVQHVIGIDYAKSRYGNYFNLVLDNGVRRERAILHDPANVRTIKRMAALRAKIDKLYSEKEKLEAQLTRVRASELYKDM